MNQLGLKLNEQGDVKVSRPFNKSTVEDAFAAGDIITPMKAVSAALYIGTCTAAGV